MQRKQFYVIQLCLLLLSLQPSHAESNRRSRETFPPLPSGLYLREIVLQIQPAGHVFIGGTTGSWAFGEPQGIVLDREFNYVTPENDFKQSIVHKDPDSWNWERADAWLDHIVDHNQVLRIHGPVSPQCSKWAKEDHRTPEELEVMMRDFFTALCQRYNDHPHIRWMDVVNECVVNGKWHKDKPGSDKWELPWYKIGRDRDRNRTPSYIRYAFEIANIHAPDLKLIFNQHTLDTPTWDLIKETIAYLRGLDLRVDGIGWQAHIDQGWETPKNLETLRNLIQWAHQNDLEFHITEQSVWLKTASAESWAAQAETYGAILSTLLAERENGVVAWNTWHISDAHGWKRDKYPSIFDIDFQPKPAYYRIQEILLDATQPMIPRRR